MILTNYWKLMQELDNASNTTEYLTLENDIKSDAGVTIPNIYYGYGYYYSLLMRKALAIKVGTGNTAPTLADYGLETPIATTDMTVTTVWSTTNSGSSIETTGAVTLTNISEADITVKEIVLTKTVKQNSPSDDADVAFFREVFENPITIGAGESKTLTVLWKERVYVES